MLLAMLSAVCNQSLIVETTDLREFMAIMKCS